MKKSSKILILAMFLVLICCVSVVSAAEIDNSTIDSVSVSDDATVDDVVSEVDSDDEPIAASNDEDLESVDDSGNESLAVQDVGQVDDVDDTTLTAENDNGQNPILSSDVLSVGPSDELYVNISSSNDPASVDGQSWENALGGQFCINRAVRFINDGGKIYLADETYPQFNVASKYKNFTIIGKDRDNTIVQIFSIGNEVDANHYLTTFINITFVNSGELYGNDLTFINCTFINFKTDNPINKDIDENAQYYSENIAPEESFITTFTDCDFINSTIVGENLIDIDKYTQINFNNCNFANITADSIVSSVKGKFHTQDSINFKDCSFKNVNTKGIVCIPTGKEISELVHIEGCTYDVLVSNDVITVGGHDYINTTASRVDSILVAKVNDEENLVVSLKGADNKVIDGAEIYISVNGGQASPYALEDDGTFTIAVSDLTDATGSITITVEFKENNAYKGNLTNVPYVIRNATSITADNVTATVGEAKNITLTLKDNNGKPIAGKTITVNDQDIGIVTDANGVANIPVSVDTAGVSEYTLFFAGDDTTYKNSTLVVKVTVKEKILPNATSITADNVTTTVGTAANITLTLKDNNGKPIAGKEIKIIVNGENSTVTTDSNGVANIPVSVDKAGVSEYTLFFAGDDINYKNSTLVVKVNVTEKSTAPSTNTTNTTPSKPTQKDNAQTTTKVTKKATKITAKKATKITAKKATFKAKKKSKKYTIALKAGKKAVAKVKVTIKVGKKTYTAKTNAKGKATFNLKKLTKKGKYTAVIKFKGNKNYKATSAKVKITVK